MTVYCEDPHDSWALRSVSEHQGRATFWLGATAALILFWTSVFWVAESVF